MQEPRMLRPMEYGEIFNEAFDLYKRNFPLFVGIAAVVYVPYSLVAALLPRYPLLGYVGILLLWIPLMAANGAMIKAVADRYLGREATIGSSWGYVLRRVVPYVLTTLMGGLLVLIGLILFCVPGIIFAFWVVFMSSVVIVEDRYYTDAIRRSRQLAAGEWGRILIIFLFAMAISLGVGLVVSLISVLIMVPAMMTSRGAPVPGELPLWASLLQAAMNAIVQSLVTPLMSLLFVLLYFDVRVRKEGFDIELLAQEMGERPPGTGPSIAPA